MPKERILRLILCDQLDELHSWFKKPDANVTYVIMEIRQETDYVKHHIQKVAAFFAAMRGFRARLIEMGHEPVCRRRPGGHQTLHFFGQIYPLHE